MLNAKCTIENENESDSKQQIGWKQELIVTVKEGNIRVLSFLSQFSDYRKMPKEQEIKRDQMSLVTYAYERNNK